jgi:hypothetical protein
MIEQSTSPDLHFFFDDLINKYRQIYGDDWVGRVQPMIDRLKPACEKKDLAVLLDLLHRDNPFLREVFSRMTDISLPKTQHGLAQVLEALVGREKVTAYRTQVEQQQQLRVLEELQYKVADRYVRTTDYGTLRMDEFIHRLIQDGYTTPRVFQSGSAKSYGLYNDKQTGYSFKRKVEYLYMRAVLEQQQQAHTMATDAQADPAKGG